MPGASASRTAETLTEKSDNNEIQFEARFVGAVEPAKNGTPELPTNGSAVANTTVMFKIKDMPPV